MATLIERRKMMQGVTLTSDWLTQSAISEIKTTLGSSLGNQVIRATDTYLNNMTIAAATALAGYINIDPLMVCSLPLQGVTMPNRGIQTSNAKIKLSYPFTSDMLLEFDLSLANINNENTIMSDGSWSVNRPLLIVYNSCFRWHISSGGSIDSSVTLVPNTLYDLIVGNGTISVNGTTDTKPTGSVNSNNLILFGESATLTNNRCFAGTLFSLKITSTNQNHWYIPYDSVGTLGLLDIYDPTNTTFLTPSVGSVTITLS